MSVNVNRNVSDQFYRYKMPRLLAKVEGKGNGIKTVIVNMSEIAKSLARPAEYPTKYFGCELGAQTQMDAKNDRYIVNGSHDSEKLQTLLDGFIKKFVLCDQCENPETDLIMDKSQCIHQNCIACGHRGMVDMRHKLTTFIIKNPPESMLNTAKVKKEDKKEKKEKKEKKSKSSKSENSSSSTAPIRENPATQNRRESEIENDWSVDTSEEAVRLRRIELENDLGSAVKSLTMNEACELTVQERLDQFYNFVQEKRGTISSKEVFEKATDLDIKDRAVGILVDIYFNEDIQSQIPKHRKLFLPFTHDSKKAQKYLLGSFERLLGIAYPSLLPKAAHILKTLYDHDYLEEEVILQWGSKVSSKYVPKDVSGQIHKKSEPFLTWLATAEEEDDDSDSELIEDDDEDDVQVSYSAHANGFKVDVMPQNGKVKVEDEEEIDIDDI